jgi:hypothetical protein
MVVEEHYLSKYQIPPLLVVGWEGVFGLSLSTVFLVIAQYVPGWSTGNVLENSVDALYQVGASS